MTDPADTLVDPHVDGARMRPLRHGSAHTGVESAPPRAVPASTRR